VIACHDEQTLDLAVIMAMPPTQIDSMGYLDSLSWLRRWASRERGNKAFAAALHGRALR